jgi:hypothetical protein
VPNNFGDFQLGVYADAVKGVNSRYPFDDYQSVERKAAEALPDWVYRICVCGRRGRSHPTRQHCGVLTLRNRSPDDGQPAGARPVDRPVRQTPGIADLHVPDRIDRLVRTGFPGRSRRRPGLVALALGATAVGIGRPYAYALSYGGTESLTHYLKTFLAELDLCLAICGFKDIASLKEAGCEEALTFCS